jgi:hypothetical protein
MATFGLSNTTDVFISEDTQVNGIRFTSAATNPYTIAVNPGITLTLSGKGITNNSGITQTFFLVGSDKEGGQINFTNGASAGNANIVGGDGFTTIHFLTTLLRPAQPSTFSMLAQ